MDEKTTDAVIQFMTGQVLGLTNTLSHLIKATEPPHEFRKMLEDSLRFQKGAVEHGSEPQKTQHQGHCQMLEDMLRVYADVEQKRKESG